MPELFTDANPGMIAYYLRGSGMDGVCGCQNLPEGHSSMEAEYVAIIYGLNEYFLKWNRELDARQGLLDAEKAKATGEFDMADVASPADKTKRALPAPVLVCCDNEVVVKQLSRQYHIGNARLRKLAMTVWQMAQNIDVKYQWVSRSQNLAGKMLK